jgi:tetratricopeptide (TPR) repeat protein
MNRTHPEAAEVLEARDRLVSSPVFVRSRRLIRLLEFTIDAALSGRTEEIKEYTIGLEVYGRGPDFDPRADSIVRVEASRLRQKLAEHYRTAGQSDPIRIDYPKGAYIPEFRFSTPLAPPEPLPAAPRAPAAQPNSPARPPNSSPAPGKTSIKTRALVAACTCAAVALFVVRGEPTRGLSGALPPVRPGVAVLSPVNLAGESADSWLSAAIRELVASELSAGGKLRLPPGELVARSERMLSPPPSAGPDTFTDIARTLGVDTVLTGSYLVVGDPGNRQLHVDVQIQRRDSPSGQTVSETGTPGRLLELARRLGFRLRERLGVPEASESHTESSPASPPAEEAYYRALQRFRAYDPLGALRDLDETLAQDPAEPLSFLLRAECLEVLGRDPEASHAIEQAFELRRPLAREQQLTIEAERDRLQHTPGREAEVFRALVTFYPDDIEYRFQLVRALNEAGRYPESMTEIADMRALPAPLNQDPRIDWADLKTAHMQTDFPRRLASAQKLEQKARLLHADWLLADALIREVSPLARANRLPEAKAALQAAREIDRRLGDREGVAYTYRNEGNLLVAAGDAPKALEAFNRDLAIGTEAGNLEEMSNAWNAVGVVRRILGDLPGAREALEQSLRIATQRQSPMAIKMANLNLADVQLTLGDLAGARRQFTSALETSRQLGEAEGEAKSLLGLGYVQLFSGEFAQALSQFEGAAAVAHHMPDAQLIGESAIAVANVHLATHRLDLARPAVLDARRLAETSGDVYNRIESHFSAARLAIAENRFAAASAELRAAKPLVDQNRAVDLCLRWATLLTENALAQHQPPGGELEQLRRIPAGSAKASALTAQVVLARATHHDADGPLAEAHRLSLVLIEADSRAAAVR